MNNPTPKDLEAGEEIEVLSDNEYLDKAKVFLEKAKKMDDAPVAFMVAAAFKNEDKVAALRAELVALKQEVEQISALSSRCESLQHANDTLTKIIAVQIERLQELRQVVKAAIGVRRHGTDYLNGTHAQILWRLVDAHLSSPKPAEETK